jgi:hypothetical protein
MRDEQLLARIRELREAGRSPKGIAKALGLRPAVVAPLVRQVAAEQQVQHDPADRALLGCWVNRGWSVGLGLADVPEWAALDTDTTDDGPEGLAQVLVARQERASRASVCGILVDLYCLGVKNAIGPLPMGRDSIDRYRATYFEVFDEPPLSIPVELAQHLVYGAVAYAGRLGFQPHPDFAAAADHLGPAPATTPIGFGRDGRPFYVDGPNDNPHEVIRTLESSVGPGNFDYVTHL